MQRTAAPRVMAEWQKSQRDPVLELRFLKMWARDPAMGWLTRCGRGAEEEHRVHETSAPCPKLPGLQLFVVARLDRSGPTSPGRPEPPKQRAAATAGAQLYRVEPSMEDPDLQAVAEIVAGLTKRAAFFAEGESAGKRARIQWCTWFWGPRPRPLCAWLHADDAACWGAAVRTFTLQFS